MKLIVIAGLFVLSAFAQAQTCKVGLYGPYGQFITSVRTENDRQCMKAVQACRNWKVWYVAPSDSRCIRLEDDGEAVIDYVRYPDYDTYYGYTGSPYYRVPRVPQQPTTSSTRYCYERNGRETCYDVPAGRTLVCEEYDDGSERCYYEPTREERRPETRPQPRPETRPEPTPTPNTNPMPQPRPETRPEPRPTPTPTPNTNPVPVPTPQAGTDAVRPIEAGETVIFNSALHMVVSVENTNFYNLKPVNGRDRDIVKDVARQYVAVTRGCNVGFCANDSVIVLASSTFAAVAGIEYDGQLVLKTVDGTDKLTFDVNPSALAWTKGCSPEGSNKVCVGNVVMKGRGPYYTVVGIQLDGNVVIENNDGPKKLAINVNPSTLLIVR